MQKPWKCFHCLRTLSSSAHLTEHLQRFHGERKPFQCFKCLEVYYSAIKLCVHINTRHTRPFKCFRCFASFSTKRGLSLHMDIIHLQRRFGRCFQCHHSAGMRSHLNIHIKSHYLPVRVRCFRCLHYVMELDMSRHLRKACSKRLNENCFICFQCLDVSKTRVGMLCHKELMHVRHTQYECRICCKKYMGLIRLNFHTRRMHKNSFCCYRCMVYKSKQCLIHHLSATPGCKLRPC